MCRSHASIRIIVFILFSKIKNVYALEQRLSQNVLNDLCEGSRLHRSPLVPCEPQGAQQAVIAIGDQEKCEPCHGSRRTAAQALRKKTAEEMMLYKMIIVRSFIYHHLDVQTEQENECDDGVFSSGGPFTQLPLSPPLLKHLWNYITPYITIYIYLQWPL